MKKILSIGFLAVFLAFFMPVRSLAQDEYVDILYEKMNGYYKDLVKLDKEIQTVEDAENKEAIFKNLSKRVEQCYSSYSDFFDYEKGLSDIYDNFSVLYDQLDKRIQKLKADKDKQDKIDKLASKFNYCEATLKKLEQDANRYVENNQPDSLKLVQKKALDTYNDEANAEYIRNKELIEESDTLNQSWKRIKDINSRISTLEIVEKKGFFNMDNILKIVGILAAVVLIVTMISNKVKAAKLTNPKKKEPKKPKKEEDLPSI